MDLSEINVLIVDDIKTVRNVLKKNLITLGVKYIEEASNIKDAKKVINSRPVDLILSD
ncbi:MAG: hypothetical protein KC493_03905 [Bacteriovoracaceae bacterium]|nr:hypothetical protein [Bacteriovoracaceae bacterium]